VVIDIVLSVAVLALLIARQLQARRVSSQSYRIVIIFAIIGVIEVVSYYKTNHPGAAGVAALAGSLVLAAVFGALRALTVKVWSQEGQAWSQGNWLTAVLWVIALGAHFGYDYLVSPGHGKTSIGTATAVLYLAVSFGIQRVIIAERARRIAPSDGSFSGGGIGPVGGFS
jgi:hypothetical protein